MAPGKKLRLFEGFGVELEYMICRRASLDVLPMAHKLLRAETGRVRNEVEHGPLAWSNELVRHVIELKTNGPAPSLDNGLDRLFQEHVGQINTLLAPLDGCLMPTAMHPWMNPATETQLWRLGGRRIYQTYDRIFQCNGHGWANLQSVHLNLPFGDDAEFGRLHAAVRLVLPLIPALAASSPLVEGKPSGLMDSRINFYRRNQRRVPIIAGEIIPEPVYTRADYQHQVFQRIYTDMAPHDPEGILRHEWLNSRGAIARFNRNTIEIRLTDIQECPAADLALANLLVAVIRSLVAERWCDHATQAAYPTSRLANLLDDAVCRAEQTQYGPADYLRLFGLKENTISGSELLEHLCDTCLPGDNQHAAHIRRIARHGVLARRILRAVADDYRRPRLAAIYRELCDCLQTGKFFRG